MDFMLKAARERESSNKRKIKPKAIDDDDLLLAEDSDDSDFNVGSGADSAVEEDTSDGDSAGNGSDDDGSGSDDDGSSDDDSSEEDSKGTSALREGFKKFEDTPAVRPKKRKRKKPVAKKTKDEDEGKSNGVKESEGTGDSLANGPSKPKKKKSAPKKKKKKEEDDCKSKKKSDEKKKKEEKNRSKSILNKVKKMDDMTSDTRAEIDLKTRICSFCLGTSSDGSNEIVECDSCGITVHEVCYGVSDTASLASGTESSNSTEPWFCDACKSSCGKVSCDLCPVKDGLFKETNTGRFVHLVCAMYTPGVRVLDDGVPDLREIPVATWGNYFCFNCDDERHARTGIAIRCDAGLCKNYLHASCAQKEGLLSDPNAVDPENPVADPYYVSCKIHCPKKPRKKRAENYDILQEQKRVRQEQKTTADLTLTDVEKAEQNRIKKKIDKIRTKSSGRYSYTRSEGVIQLPPIVSPTTSDALCPSSVEISKKSRHVDSSTTADRFFTKAVLAGANLKSLELEDKKERIVATIGKKWNVLPALNVEFAAYYSDRENRLESLVEQVDTLEDQKNELADLHTGIKNVFDTMGDEHKDLVTNRDNLVKSLRELEHIVKLFQPDKKVETGIPAALTSKKRRHSGSPNRKSPASKRDRSSASSSKKKSQVDGASPNGSQSPPGRLKILRCDVCNKSDDQHLITKCDKCKRCFHLGCLDPPLTRMPKRTRVFGWMCSDCGEETEEESEPEVDTEAPRSLRGRESLKRPNKYRNVPTIDVSAPTVNGTIKKPASIKEKSTKVSSTTKSSPKSSSSKKSPKSSPKTQKSPSSNSYHNDIKELSGSSEGKCVTCSKIDVRKNMVMCDKCSEEFHFGCLDPPLKYTPKRRGYSWFCVTCDEKGGNEEASDSTVPDDDDSLEIVSS